MPYRKRSPRKRYLWIPATLIILLVLFAATFFTDLVRIFRAFLILLVHIIGYSVPYPAGALRSFDILMFNLLFGFGLVFLLWLVLVSGQAILPVRKFRRYWSGSRAASRAKSNGNGAEAANGYAAPNTIPVEDGNRGLDLFITPETPPQEPATQPEHSTALEIARTAWHFLLHMIHLHGPAVYVKDGQIRGSDAELDIPLPGVAVVDFNSAIVLDERMPRPNLLDPIWKLAQGILVPFQLSDPSVSSRAIGPGLVFTRRSEKIRGAVNLRKQFRYRSDVSCYTRDGIELVSTVWCIFTIGEEPDVLQVTYDGPLDDLHQPNNLRVVSLEKIGGGRVRVKNISDELDEDDRQEIHHYFRVDNRRRRFSVYKSMREPGPVPVFDAQRVFSALYSRARSDEEGELIPWDQLPAEVASDMFRNLIHQVNFDQLYEFSEGGNINYVEYKGKLRRTMRNNGIASYRLVLHQSGRPLAPGEEYRESELWSSPVRPLTTPKFLRNRGIKVIASGFSEPVPTTEDVYEKRLQRWRAPWERDTEINRAHQELEAMRIRTRARILAQQEFIYSLAQILQNQEHSEEVAAIRVLQALEAAADDPNTRQLLPKHIILLMRTLHDWLLPEEASPPAPGFDDQL